MKRKKYLTRLEAWQLAEKLAEKLGSIESVAKEINAATSTIYKWSKEGGAPDVRITLELEELAKKEGIKI